MLCTKCDSKMTVERTFPLKMGVFVRKRTWKCLLCGHRQDSWETFDKPARSSVTIDRKEVKSLITRLEKLLENR